ncbi:NAD(P)/FAD-dependent oxidoreductase [Ideonella livida]|uniref:NAD(P)/FAD-dependent oxidoreductase n=1 Tax=Ideonella livida TaxID=2707176 RepID=UPI002873E592|nr:FAD-dependent oxidoreductase [Ideonella livida]
MSTPTPTATAAPLAAGEAARFVAVGAGQAALACAEALRAQGFTGAITLLGDEPWGPYHRPPLSKAWLAGELGAEQLAMRAPALLAKKGITLRTGTTVQAIDRAAREVLLAGGERLPYDGLLLATGATPRRLPLPGGDAPNVLPLRTRAEADALAAGLARCAELNLPLVVIGGGFIGLEVAATARKKGLAVTVLEAAPRLLGRVLAPVLSDWFAQLHRQHGVALHLGAQIEALETDADGLARAVHLKDGTRLPCALVVLGVGVGANDALASACGLPTERGIVVDACGRTADPAIVAAGDCAARRLPDGSLLRLESVQNATEQGKSAAAALLGQDRPFTATPWFWSDQYDKKLQMAGLSTGADAWAVRGELTGEAGFSVWHFRAGRLIAVDAVNHAKDHLLSRKLLEAGVSPTPEQVVDLGCDLAARLQA